MSFNRKKHSRSWLDLIGIILLLFIGHGCNTQSAVPQISIPAPANECSSHSNNCITVATDSANSLVTVTAGAGAVPDSSTVLLRIESNSVSKTFLEWLIPSATAQSCSSDLPVCQADGSTDSCQTTANSDGSFSVSLTGNAGDDLTISYLDSNTCNEEETLTEEVTNGFFTLSLEGASLSVNSNDTIFVFGTNLEGNNQVSTVVVNSNNNLELGNQYLPDISGDPIGIDYLPQTQYMALLSDSEFAIYNPASDNLAAYNIDDSIGAFIASQKSYNYPSSSEFSVNYSCLGNDYSGRTVDRVIIAHSAEELARNPDSPFKIMDGAYDGYDFLQSIRSVSYDFEDLDVSLVGATLTEIVNLQIDHQNLEGFFIGNFTLADNTERMYLIEIPLTNQGFCSTIDSSLDLEVLALPTDLNQPRTQYWLGRLTDNLLDESIITMDGNNLLVMDLDGDQVYSDELDITPLTTTSYLNGLTHIIPQEAAMSHILNFIGISSEHRRLVGLEMTGTQAPGDSTTIESIAIEEFETGISLGIRPIEMKLLTDVTGFSEDFSLFDGSLIILNQGLADDGSCTLQHLDLLSLDNLEE